MNNGPILSDEIVKQLGLWKYVEQVAQFTRRDKDKLAPGYGERAQRGNAALVAATVARERAVKPSGKHDVAHDVHLAG